MLMPKNDNSLMARAKEADQYRRNVKFERKYFLGLYELGFLFFDPEKTVNTDVADFLKQEHDAYIELSKAYAETIQYQFSLKHQKQQAEKDFLFFYEKMKKHREIFENLKNWQKKLSAFELGQALVVLDDRMIELQKDITPDDVEAYGHKKNQMGDRFGQNSIAYLEFMCRNDRRNLIDTFERLRPQLEEEKRYLEIYEAAAPGLERAGDKPKSKI